MDKKPRRERPGREAMAVREKSTEPGKKGKKGPKEAPKEIGDGPLDLIENLKVLGRVRRDWSQLPIHGELIRDLFLPMKSPICLPPLTIAPEKEWNGLDFYKFLKEHPEYGLVVNLCVSQYYRPLSVTKAGVEYVHLPIQCYSDVVPTQAAFDAFMDTVDDFRDKNPGKKVILTSTMGLNRCAFFIAEYFSDEMDRFECLKLFVKRRRPHILRLSSLTSYLKKVYGEKGLKPEHYVFMTTILAESHCTELESFNVLAKY